jgi:predicted O-methyltransferase YrrM
MGSRAQTAANTQSTSSLIQDLYATAQPPIDVDRLLPDNLGLWPVSRPMARWLACAVHGLQRRSVLEFGAGWSSLVLAESLAAAGGGRLTSIEHQPKYLREDLWEKAQRAAAVDAALVVTPLHRRLSTYGLLWSYRDLQEKIARRAPYDLLFIDAPPARYGRTSPLHDAYPFLAPGAVIVLDDAARVEEQTTIKRWLSVYPGLELVVLDKATGRGIAVLLHDGTKRRRIAARAVAGTLRDQWRDWRRSLFSTRG